MAQFRAGAHLLAAANTPVRSVGRLRRVLAAPVVAVVATGALAAGGGLALAASYGKIDVPFLDGGTGNDRPERSPGSPGSATASGHGARPDGPRTTGPGGRPTENPSDPGSRPAGSPSAAPTPSFTGLCRAFQAGAYHDGKTSPAFAALVAEAGGRDQVAAFCADLIGTPKPKPTPRPHPSQAGRPGEGASPTKPSQAATPAKPTTKAQPTSKPRPTHAAKPSKTPNQ